MARTLLHLPWHLLLHLSAQLYLSIAFYFDKHLLSASERWHTTNDLVIVIRESLLPSWAPAMASHLAAIPDQPALSWSATLVVDVFILPVSTFSDELVACSRDRRPSIISILYPDLSGETASHRNRLHYDFTDLLHMAEQYSDGDSFVLGKELIHVREIQTTSYKKSYRQIS